MKKNILVVGSMFLLILVVQCFSPKSMGTNIKVKKAKEVSVMEQLQQGGILVDVRTKEEFDGGSIRGAVNIPLYDIESRLEELKDKPYVILFCKTGHRAGIAQKMLEKNGINHVTNGINILNINDELKNNNTNDEKMSLSFKKHK